MQGPGWSFKKYGDHNLSKLVIEPEIAGHLNYVEKSKEKKNTLLSRSSILPLKS